MIIVIMAGGTGTRFWPYSTQKEPKQFLPILSDEPLLIDTCRRVKNIAGKNPILIVVSEIQREILEQILEKYVDLNVEVLYEPILKDTAPCIALTSAYVAKKYSEDEVMVFLPSDHYIGNVNRFLQILEKAEELAREGNIVTIGIPISKPETGFGYIQRGDVVDRTDISIYKVKCFVEKPNYVTAIEYLKSGEYFWNAGIYLFSPKTISAEIEKYEPELYESLYTIKNSIDTHDFYRVLCDEFEKMKNISFDYAIMEKTTAPVYVLEGDFIWNDIGNWDAIFHLLKNSSIDNVTSGNNVFYDARNNLVINKSNKLISLVGTSGLFVIETDKVVLVGSLDRAQDVKNLVKMLENNGMDKYL